MILKRNFNPLKVIGYVRTELLVSFAFSFAAWFLQRNDWLFIILPFSVSAILGSALAIFIAFRNNTSYARWWEARTIWGNIVNSSRIIARQIITCADDAVITGKVSTETAESFKKDFVYRQMAFAHALRLRLRNQSQTEILKDFLSEKEFKLIREQKNIPNRLLHLQGLSIKEGIRLGVLGPFDNIGLEPALASFNHSQGNCERIKNTPLLRQYDYFNRLFLLVFMIVLPFSLIGDFQKLNMLNLIIPISLLISGVFAIMGKVGEINENPFENQISDVPMTALCSELENDLKEMLNETILPKPADPLNGYLF